MRPNIVFVTLLLMLGGLAAGVALRGRATHQAPPLPAEASASAPEATASAAASTTASGPPPATSAAAPKEKKLSLERPLRVVSLGWELLAAGVMANDGADPGPESTFKKAKLEVFLRGKNDAAEVEHALARGGKDDGGADIAIMPLPRFVASYERLKALNPVIFFVVGWSEGGEVVLSTKTSFGELPPRDTVVLQAEAGSAAAFVGLFALELAGTAPERVELRDGKADWMAMPRRQAKSTSEQVKANMLLTTGEASRLVPYVAIAQAALIDQHADVLEVWAGQWLEGNRKVAADASEAARKVAEAKGAPLPLDVLSRLGEITPASLAENASATGLSGRGAVTLESLFRRSWDVWRKAKVLTIPPENAPVDGRVVAALVRAGGELGAPSTGGKGDKPNTDGKPLLVHRVPAANFDSDAFVENLGFIAGVFRRSPIRVSVHPRGSLDAKQTEAVIQLALEQFGLTEERLVAGKERPTPGSAATVEVMPVP